MCFFMQRLGAGGTEGGHCSTWKNWVGTSKEGEIGINRNGTKKDDKRAENVNNTFKKQIGVGKLPKAELVVTLRLYQP